jgi:D-serine deaminase-like pyridoxal phosphate-dependent protein
MDDAALRRLGVDHLDLRYKGFAPTLADATVDDLASRAPRLLDAGFSFPLLTLHRSAVEHNVAALAEYCRQPGVQLAPQGRSTKGSPRACVGAVRVADGAASVVVGSVSCMA